jgi:3-methyladenine DNA glycosylase AlkC
MTEALKDQLFNRDKVARISHEIQSVYPAFKAQAFTDEVVSEFTQLELKARINWISVCLRKYLPPAYRKATDILLKALPPACDPELTDHDYGEFIYAPYSEFVSQYGCNAQDLDYSLSALKEMTTRFSAEFAIRAFLNAFPEQTLASLQLWAQDSHYHVRRLASEGTRPKLPWSQRISLPPEAALPVLDQLHDDLSRFVTRSVANHLNDLSKISPELVLKTLKVWQGQKRQNAPELDYMTRHALRTLIKRGHPETLQFLGYPTQPQIRVANFTLATERLQLGQALSFDFEIEALEASRLVVDYCLHFQNRKGSLSPKVFKLRILDLQAGQTLSLHKNHPLKEMTTRHLYPGLHKVELQINGQSFGERSFVLE